MLDQMEETVISIKQRIADMKMQLTHKSNNVVSDPKPAPPNKGMESLRNALRSASTVYVSESQRASERSNLYNQLKSRIAKEREKSLQRESKLRGQNNANVLQNN